MSGDNLNALFFVASIGAAGVMGAIATNGIRARILWGIALAGLVGSVACLQADAASPFIKGVRTLWLMSPVIGVVLALLVSGGRKPLERRKPLLAPPTINTALTADHFNSIVDGGTQLEAKRKLASYGHQRARLRGEIESIAEVYGRKINVKVRGMNSPGDYRRTRTMEFRQDQADALEVIKPGDWIEFTGQVHHDNISGWELVDCEFVSRADPPPKSRAPRRKPAP